MEVPEETGWDVPNFSNDVPNFVKSVPNLSRMYQGFQCVFRGGDLPLITFLWIPK